MSSLDTLPPAVQAYVVDFVARARRIALWRAVGRAVAFFLAFALACCLLDRVAHLAGTVRATLLAVGLMGVGLIFRPFVALRFRKRINWIDTAHDIEEHNPQFAQRLLTVTSQLLGPAEHRGSDDMLYHLIRDVDQQASTHSQAHALPISKLIRPWLAVVLLCAVAGGLSKAPILQMPALAQRFARPLADLPPVTTTHLHVMPGDANVAQAKPLEIVVDSSKLPPEAGVFIHFTKDGHAWTRTAMLPAEYAPSGTSSSRFSYSLNAVDRDIEYYISGGDAESRKYTIRVLRTPAVAQFSIRYSYPAHTLRAPLTVTNTDGAIEAPAGTTADVTLTSTEPLQSALMGVDGHKMLMQRVTGGGDSVREASIVVDKDASYSIDLISTRDVAGAGPGTMHVHAVADQKPVVRLTQPKGSLRLTPSDIVPLSYEAIDDFGIQSLFIRLLNSDGETKTFPLPILGDPRQQNETFNLDLATVKLAIGDLAAITIVAQDRSGQEGVCIPLQILLSPRSVDVDTHQRISELSSAVSLAEVVIQELQAAAAAMDQSAAEKTRNTAASTVAASQGNKHISSAAELAALVRQSLMRAIVRSNTPELSTALAGWIDSYQVLSSLSEDLFRQKGISALPSGQGGREKLGVLLESSKRVRDEIRIVAVGEQAAALLADRENLRSTQARPAPKEPAVAQSLQQMLARAGEEVSGEARQLGLDPGAGNLDDQLRDRTRASEALVKGRKPIDFADESRQWSQALQRDASQVALLDERLSAAAQAEAVRPFGELVRARDLQLGGRAAAALAERAAAEKTAGRPVTAATLNQFAQAMADLQREHEIDRPTRDAKPRNEVDMIRRKADQARAAMRRWAGDVAVAGASAPTTNRNANNSDLAARRQVEEVALQASAESAQRNYDKADQLDGALLKQLVVAESRRSMNGSAPASAAAHPATVPARLLRQGAAIAQSMSVARQLDHLSQQQDQLADKTKTAGQQAPAKSDVASTSTLAEDQRKVAEAIAVVPPAARALGDDRAVRDPIEAATQALDSGDDPNRRSRAASTVLAAQEQLAAMPQRLAEVRQVASEWKTAQAMASMAQHEFDAAPIDRKAAANRAAQQAARDARDAEDRLLDVSRPIIPAAGSALAGRLDAFAPDTAGARDAVLQKLVPALRELADALKTGDAGAADRSAAQARAAIESAQQELGGAQDSLTQRDPLVAARWFARAAADSLSQNPPDLKSAQKRQGDASLALSAAWDQSIHVAAAQRLALVPSMQSLYAPPESTTDHPGATAAASASTNLAAAREWGRLRPREADELSSPASLRDTDPPGFEESLQKYFESIGTAKNQ